MRLNISQLRSRVAALLRRPRAASPWAVASLQPGRLCAIVVAPAAHGARPGVLAAGELAFDEAAPASGALTAFARELQATGLYWALLLAREEYRLSVMPEPDVPPAELAQSVRWQLAATIDFPAEDAAVDFLPIPTREHAPQRTPELYAVAARGDAVSAHAAMFRGARLDLRAIDIRETAQRNIAALLERGDELLVMVAFCDDGVQISFSWRHELYMDRLIAEPACHDEDVQRRAAACERIRVQLQRSLDAVRSDFPFLQAARIVLAGAPHDCRALLQEGLFDPVEELVPDDLFDLSRVPQLQEPRAFMRHFHALGVALRDSESH
jgi:MSHA biogenesis protein MshI